MEKEEKIDIAIINPEHYGELKVGAIVKMSIDGITLTDNKIVGVTHNFNSYDNILTAIVKFENGNCLKFIMCNFKLNKGVLQ